jgi:uncharacterized protein YdiU (UPF0061 family)
MLRELIISEAMYYLGIPTSRSLAVVKTGEPVFREQVLPGAVLTRIMSSHIRIGTFEYASHYGSQKDLEALLDYTVTRHYPSFSQESVSIKALSLLKVVIEKQVSLLVQWLRVGFIHGVMNTDNTSISGKTFDYGPCAFLNSFKLDAVFSSIDTNGRYAFDKQAGILLWNISVLANALLPCIDNDKQIAAEKAGALLDEFESSFHQQWYQMMFRKIGMIEHSEADKSLLHELLHNMQLHQLDYTETFLWLMNKLDSEEETVHPLNQWVYQWKTLLKNDHDISLVLTCMQSENPVYIPRNHWVEDVLSEALQENLLPLEQLLDLIRSPYIQREAVPPFKPMPAHFDLTYKTFCGT